MMRYIAMIWLMTLSLTAQEITIAVAANVSYAIDDLKTAFMAEHPETKVRVIIGGSGKLTAQIRRGAPFGLFMSANMRYPEALYEAKVATTPPRVYAEGALALFSVRARDFSLGMQLLSAPQIRTIAVANPKTAPYGKAALEAMQKAHLYELVKPKLVYGESIAQTVAYAVTAAEVGIIAKSSLYSEKMRHYEEGRNWVSVDPSLYQPIEQGIVLLRDAQGKPGYQEFYDFILSEKAKKIFRKYGYILP